MTTTARRNEIKAIIASCNDLHNEATSSFCFEAFQLLLGDNEAFALATCCCKVNDRPLGKEPMYKARDLAIEFGLDEHIGRDKATDLIARYQGR